MSNQNISYISGTPVVIDTLTTPSVTVLPEDVDSFDGQLCVLSSPDTSIKGLYVYNVDRWEILATSSKLDVEIGKARTKVLLLRAAYTLGIRHQENVGYPWSLDQYIDTGTYGHNPTNSERQLSEIEFKESGMYRITYMFEFYSGRRKPSINIRPYINGVDIPNTYERYKVDIRYDDDDSSDSVFVTKSFVVTDVVAGDVLSIMLRAILRTREYINIRQSSYLLVEKIFTGAQQNG